MYINSYNTTKVAEINQKIKVYFYLCVRVCVRMWVCAHSCRYPWKPETSDPLEMELQKVVSCLTWVLGTELESPVLKFSLIRTFSLTAFCNRL